MEKGEFQSLENTQLAMTRQTVTSQHLDTNAVNETSTLHELSILHERSDELIDRAQNC